MKPRLKSVITGVGRSVARIATADRDAAAAAAPPPSSITSHLLLSVLPACTHTKKTQQLRFSGVAIRSLVVRCIQIGPSNDQTLLAPACFPPIRWHSVVARIDSRVRR